MSVVDSNKKATRTRATRSRVAAAKAEPAQPVMPLYFEHQTDKSRSWTGNTAEVRIVGNSLRDPQGREAAYYAAGTWRIGDDRFRFLEFGTPVTVQVESENQPSRVFGPLQNVRLIDGVVRYGAQREHYLARFDQPTRCWQLRDDQSLWSTLVFVPVAEAAASP